MDLTVYDHLLNPIIAVDKTGKINYVNFICSLFFKIPPRKIKSLQLITELIQTDQLSILETIEKCLNQNDPIIGPEIEIQGEKNYTVVLKFIPLDENCIIHLQDFSIEKQLHEKYKEQIIELKETHQQIIKSDKLTALGELISGVSHEISSPLTIASDLLLEISEKLFLKEYAEVENDIGTLSDEFLRIKEIVSNMQSMAQNEEQHFQVVDLESIIQKSLSFVKDLSLLEDIKVETKLGPIYVLANEGKLQQVLINLIKNSTDALSNTANKKINISLMTENQTVILDIIDNGKGVEAEDKLFEMFYTTKDLGEGTGLGLSISQKIMNFFHGEIKYIPTKSGAHFQLDLPMLDLESFTSTNRYLKGECETEDLKALIYSDSLEFLDSCYQSFLRENVVTILTQNVETLEDLSDSYLVDMVFIHGKGKELEGVKTVFLTEKDDSENLEKMREVILGKA